MAESSERYTYEGLEPIYIETARKELKEDPERVNAHIESLRNWLHQSKHIKNCPDDNEFLLRFLRVAKFNHENAQSRLENFCTIRGSEERGARELVAYPDLNNPLLRKFLRSGMQVPCGYNDKGHVVFVGSMRGWDPAELSYAEMVPYMWMGLECILADPRSQIAGITMVFDLDGLSKKQVDSMFSNQAVVKNVMKLWQDASPMRNRDVYYYREPVIFDVIFNIIKFWIKPKLQKRLHRVGNDLSKIHAKMSGAKKILPKEFGGENGTLEELIDKWEKRFFDYWSKPHPCKDLYVDESLRPKDTLKFLKDYKDYPDDIFGKAGTFTKIEAD